MAMRSLVTALSVALVAVAVYFVPQQVQPEGETWLFFDGVCNLCDGFVNFVYAGDSTGRIRFGALQKHTDLLVKYGAGRYAEGGEEALTTVVVIQKNQVYVRSTAALRVLAAMDQPWRSLSVFLLLPQGFRDWAYSVIGRNRYTLFGKKDSCMKPSGDFKRRFIEYNAADDEDSKNPFVKSK
eukprot:TRINITY_DN1686_c5_g1_i1.p1 TRINITY_DN1686_c5_g1~~TRINITY_DN1686_c5_g1_i1.p1  ORF type:complete len:182 (+),score=23.62 TRINITY_DN1686_c5_g1_i1:21-566(+)